MPKGSLFGKVTFIEKYPWVFIIIVFLGTEIGLYATGYSNFDKFNTSPLMAIGLMLLKLAIIAGLTFVYLSLRSKKMDKETTTE